MRKARMSARFEPLREPNQFRLLQLQPGSPNEQIRCSLTVAEIPQPETVTFTTPPYQALSYVWGQDPPTHEILIDGWYCLVRENLFQFLIQQRHPEDSCTLWIDAVCIDQVNLRERSFQVQSMGKIYRAATKVLVWLGTASPEIDIAMDFLGEEIPLRLRPPHDLNSSVLNAIDLWGRLPYWSRTWVIQEFLQAQELTLICGEKTVKWSTAMSTYGDLLGQLDAPEYSDSRYSRIRSNPALTLLRQRKEFVPHKALLAQLIINNQASLCLEPRDKVYAFLSLASDSHYDSTLRERTITVDYSMNVETLFCEVMSFCKRHISSLNGTMAFGSVLASLLQIDALPLDRKFRFDSDVAARQSIMPLRMPSRAGMATDSSTFETVMFEVGYVVCNELLPHLSPTDSSEVDSSSALPPCGHKMTSGRLPVPSRAREYFSNSELHKLTTHLELVDLRRLLDETNTLYEISAPRDSSEERSKDSSTLSLNFSLIIAYFAHHQNKHFALGLAYGDISKGDAIAQIQGYETAFTIRSWSTKERALTGRVLFASADEPWIEPVTGRSMEFQTLRTEAELSSPSRPFKLLMAPKELLSFLTLR